MGGGSFVLNCTLSDSYSAFDSTFPSLQVERSGLGAAWRTWAASPRPRPAPPVPVTSVSAAGGRGCRGAQTLPSAWRRKLVPHWPEKAILPRELSPLTRSSSSAASEDGTWGCRCAFQLSFPLSSFYRQRWHFKEQKGKKNQPPHLCIITHRSYSQQRNAFPVIFMCFWTLMQTM